MVKTPAILYCISGPPQEKLLAPSRCPGDCWHMAQEHGLGKRRRHGIRPQGQPPGRRGERTPDRMPPGRGRTDHAPSVQPTTHPGDIWLYGRHAVAAALANPQRRIRRLVALPETAEEGKRLAAAVAARLLGSAALEILPREAFEALLPAGAVHQGLALAAVPLPALALEDVIAGDVI